MEYFSSDIKFKKMRRKSKIKCLNIIKNSKAFPSFLSTKHYYKRRNSTSISFPKENKNPKINPPSEIFKKMSPKKLENILRYRRKSLPLTGKNLLHLSPNKKRSSIFSTKKREKEKETLNDESESNKKKKKTHLLSISDKLNIKSILKNFQNNQLTIKSLYNIEKKFPLNSLTESNYLFLFTNYNNKKKYKNVSINNITTNPKLSKSSLLSLKMMKRFNNKANKLLEVLKMEGTKYSNKINEFRKQIINSYKDIVVLKDLYTGKINYENALRLLDDVKEKRIKEAMEMEKDFYKNKYKENGYLVDTRRFSEESTKNKFKRAPTMIIKKLKEKINSLSPKKNESENNLNKYSFKILNSHKLKVSQANSNKNNYFNKTYLSKINEKNEKKAYKFSKSFNYSNKKLLTNTISNQNTNIINNNKIKNLNNINIIQNNKINNFHTNPNTNTKTNIINNNNKNVSNFNINNDNNNNNKNAVGINSSINSINNYYNKNIYLNYINNTKILGNNDYNPINKTEKILLDSREEYKKYVKDIIKERSKLLADSMYSINNYYEYQPLADTNSDMPQLNINITNLKRVIKVNNIKKNLFSADDDVLLLQNVKKLKEEVRDAEIQYYSCDGNKKQYNLSFVKNDVKAKTIMKLNMMKNSHFGVPC